MSLRFTPDKCPECGEPAWGEVDTLQGVAGLDRSEDGTYEWTGNTEVDWNAQEPVTDSEGRVLLACVDGHEWYARREGV